LPALQPFLFTASTWQEVRDGNDTARAIFDRHYSRSRYRYADGRKPLLFVGPGEKMVLLTQCARALLVWRRFRSQDSQEGVNCAVFRNEGAGLASDLLKEGCLAAWRRWPGERLYTYVDPRKVKGNPPGSCFMHAGWSRCGITKVRKYYILEIRPGVA
jgi:hypothetical protein